MSVRTIAKKLNVSASTVSLALRGSSKISAEMRARVKKEADLIGYRGDAKLREVMSQLRSSTVRSADACLGLLSFGGGPNSFALQKRNRAVCLWLASRAEKLGYRLESFSLKEMSAARLRFVLETRGIEGLLCFSDDCVKGGLPDELSGFSIVGIGGSLGGKVDCVAPDYFNDLEESVRRLVAAGRSRVGLVLGDGLDLDAANRYLGAFLAQQSELGKSPWLRCSAEDSVSLCDIGAWLEKEQPDALLCAGISSKQLGEALAEVGLAETCQTAFLDIEDAGRHGMFFDIEEIGCRAVDLLVRAICQGQCGFRAKPHIELVRSIWGEPIANSPSIVNTDLCRAQS